MTYEVMSTPFLFGSNQTGFDDIPVDNVPNGLDVVGSDVSVVNVVGYTFSPPRAKVIFDPRITKT
jgi:hypothetical protein